MILTRDQILEMDDIRFEDIPVPEWKDGMVRIKTLTGQERDAFEGSIVTGPSGRRNLDNVRARLVAKSAIGEDDKRLFSTNDVLALGRKSAKALDRLFAAAQRMSGLRPEDVKELAGNSPANPGDSSTSD